MPSKKKHRLFYPDPAKRIIIHYTPEQLAKFAEQEKVLAEFTKNLTIYHDGDVGPQRATPASINQINAQTKQVKRELDNLEK